MVRPAIACALVCLVAAGCPTRSPRGGGGDGPADATPPAPDARPLPDAPLPTDVCGDGICGAIEWCSCTADCGVDMCTSTCGDGWCQHGVEDCTTCPAECGTCPGTCGDGRCDDIEGCWTCANDCGICTGCDHGTCEVGPPLTATCDDCTAAVCGLDPGCCRDAWDETCVGVANSLCVDCMPAVCGDGICDRDELETCFNCEVDCECLACRHSACEVGEALEAVCAPCVMTVCMQMPECCRDGWTQACVVRLMETCWGGCGGFCGDGICGNDERCSEWANHCDADCGPCCGDGICSPMSHGTPFESCASCAVDCCEPVCGDGICQTPGEGCHGCSADCGACLSNCGDGACQRHQGENCVTCLTDCPTCP